MENEEALRRYKEKLELISYYRSSLYEFQDFLRLSVILRKLLLMDETHPAKLEELAESLFVSRSAFRRDMKKCSRFLGSYSLNLHSKPGQDTYVEGQERDVRMAMLAIYGFSLKELGMDYVEEPFFEQFSGEDFHEVRKTVHQVMRREAYTLREEMPDGLPQYLMLMRNRIKDTERFPVFSEEERIFIDNSRQMEVSRRLFEELEKYPGFDVSEDEKRLTAAYLLISHDYGREEIESGRYEELCAETEELYRKTREFIWQQWGIQGAETAVDGFLYSIVAKIVIRRKLHMLPYGTLLGRGDGGKLRCRQGELRLAMELVCWMEKYIGCGLGIRELSDLAYYFGWAISGISYDKKCLKLATVKNRLKWSDFGMVEYLVFFSMGFGRDPVFLKFVMQVLFLIQSRPEFIDQLFDSGDRRQCIMEVLIDNRFDSKYNL